ncbi:MAG: hypothetical protein KME42_04680 [Tildeniella nuda ZEHNDER 1965/U140]|jgi:hypothetical protein|nr:hypothetical protein [Tildeniella nuda ZEHNDER 1965/U140]
MAASIEQRERLLKAQQSLEAQNFCLPTTTQTLSLGSDFLRLAQSNGECTTVSDRSPSLHSCHAPKLFMVRSNGR